MHVFAVAEEDGSDGQAVFLVDEERRVHVYPDTPLAHAALSRLQSSVHIPLRFGGSITGHVLVPSTPVVDASGEQVRSMLCTVEATGANAKQVEGQPKWTLVSTWTHTPPQAWPAGELMTNLIPRPQTPVASLGKVRPPIFSLLYTLLT